MSSIFILKDEQRRENCIRYLKTVSLTKPLAVSISNKIHHSDNQRRYWHLLIGIIADFQGIHKDEMKYMLKLEWLPMRVVKSFSGKEYAMPISTKTLDKTQYAELITKTIMLGESLGLIMPSPSFWGLE